MEIFLFIVTGQLSLLIIGALRRTLSPYVKWLIVDWVWLLALGFSFRYLPEAGLWLVLAAPLVFHFLIYAFFDVALPKIKVPAFLPFLVTGSLYQLFPRWGFYLAILVITIIWWQLISDYLRLVKVRGVANAGNPGNKFKWLRSFLIFNGLLSFIVLFSQSELDSIPEFFFWTLFAGNALVCGWFFSTENAWEPLRAPHKYSSSSLDPQEKFRILSALDHQLNKENYLLQSNASLSGLAKKVHTTPHQLSQVINESRGSTFFDLLALYRVRAARRLMRDPRNSGLRIEELGEKVGYLSKSSFNTVFKKHTGKTPSEYRESVRHDALGRPNEAHSLMDSAGTGTFEPVQNLHIMFHNFFKIYFRTMARNKAFALVNILGLTAGLASTLMISLYLHNELSYDRFHQRAGDIYRVAFLNDNPQTRTPHPMAQAMVSEFPEVEAAVSLTPLYGPGLSKQSIYVRNPERDVMFREPDGFAADSTFFQVFDFRLIVGNEQDALRHPGGLILSQTLAKKYFGEENPLGKRLELGSESWPLVVTGVMEDVPANSHFHPNFVVSYVTLKHGNPNDPWMTWQDYGHFNYVKLSPGTDVRALEEKLPVWLRQLGQVDDHWYEAFLNGEWRFGLQPLTDIHLKSHVRWELEANGHMIYIYILFASILFILTIACINFINLSTARAFERAREVGVRRALGAGKGQITRQFLLEALLTCLIALILSYAISVLFLQDFNALTGKTFHVSDLFSGNLLLLLFGLTIALGLISGLLPALAASGIKAGEILKGKFGSRLKSAGVRKALVVVQFTVSAILIFGSIVLVVQIRFMEDQPLGYTDDQVLAIHLQSEKVVQSLGALKSEISLVRGIGAAGAVSNLPGMQFNQNGIFTPETPDRYVDVSELHMDFDGHRPLDLKLVAGRWFDRKNQLDSAGKSFIINETAVKALGLKDPIGQKIIYDDDPDPKDGYVIGVVKDFHYQSLHVPIQPLLIDVDLRALNYLLVKMQDADPERAIAALEQSYASFDNRYAFEAFFLDLQNRQLYEAEKRMLGIFNLFALIGLALAALGLLGLAYLMIIQRTREIGIRKTLGATIPGLIWKENLAFLRLILAGLVVGLPVSYLIMTEWLAGFAYRVTIGAGPYLITSVIVVLMAILSVTVATLRTVLTNPTEALRYE